MFMYVVCSVETSMGYLRYIWKTFCVSVLKLSIDLIFSYSGGLSNNYSFKFFSLSSEIENQSERPYKCIFKIYLFLIERYLLYSIALFSIKHQCESTIGLPMSPPTWTFLPPPSPSHPSRLLPNPSLSSLRHTANSHWLSILPIAMLFPCYSLHTSHLLLDSPAAMSTILFSMSMSPLLFQIGSSVPFVFLGSIYMC